MRDMRSLSQAVRRRVADVIAPSARGQGTLYYPQQRTCQIPMMWFLLEHFLGQREHGNFVEIGAFDGKRISNTWGLAVRGWSGLLVEPNPEFAAMARRNHRDRQHIKVIQKAVGDCDGQTIRLQLGGPMSSANPAAFAEYHDVAWAAESLTDDWIEVESLTLNTLLLEESVPIGFDLLVVDVEGFEEQVFTGFDLAHWQPKMIVVELSDLRPDLTATRDAHQRLGRDLVAAGYLIASKDAVNTVLVREDIWP